MNTTGLTFCIDMFLCTNTCVWDRNKNLITKVGVKKNQDANICGLRSIDDLVETCISFKWGGNLTSVLKGLLKTTRITVDTSIA